MHIRIGGIDVAICHFLGFCFYEICGLFSKERFTWKESIFEFECLNFCVWNEIEWENYKHISFEWP